MQRAGQLLKLAHNDNMVTKDDFLGNRTEIRELSCCKLTRQTAQDLRCASSVD